MQKPFCRRAFVVMVSWLGVFGLGAADAKQTLPTDQGALLVLIDIQNFYFPNGFLPLDKSLAAVERAKKVLDAFRQRGWPVVHVQHRPNRPLKPKEIDQYGIHAAVAPQTGEKVVTKHKVNGFVETDLAAWIRSHNKKRLVIVGMQTHLCLEAAVRHAADLGFEVWVLSDACATRAVTYANQTVDAPLVQAQTLSTLDKNYAKVLTTAEYLQLLTTLKQPK